ncbi:MAG: NifB/NifX family molybdenum-iron cluster-binding protein [Psychromonas sp.]
MITAIAMKEDRISSHFTKADSFIFMDQNGEIKAQKDNPALKQGNCSGKNEIPALLQGENVSRIIVRNIGQQILAKLLESGIAVYQSHNGHFDKSMLNDNALNSLTPLTDISQGRPSLNHQAKTTGGGCQHHKEKDSGCSDQGGHHQGNCNRNEQAKSGHGKGRCCH